MKVSDVDTLLKAGFNVGGDTGVTGSRGWREYEKERETDEHATSYLALAVCNHVGSLELGPGRWGERTQVFVF